MKKLGLVIRLAVLCGCISTPSHAQITDTVAGNDSGWYQSNGSHNPSNVNFFTGFVPGFQTRGFLTFAIPAGGPIVSAQLVVDSGLVVGGPNGVDLYAVATPVSNLRAGGNGLTAIYTDLGDGDLFGSISNMTTSAVQTVTLTPAAVAALNTSIGGDFAIGMDEVTKESVQDYVFENTSSATTKNLILVRQAAPAPVPTLSEWAMILFGLMLAGGAALYIQRRQMIA